MDAVKAPGILAQASRVALARIRRRRRRGDRRGDQLRLGCLSRRRRRPAGRPARSSWCPRCAHRTWAATPARSSPRSTSACRAALLAALERELPYGGASAQRLAHDAVLVRERRSSSASRSSTRTTSRTCSATARAWSCGTPRPGRTSGTCVAAEQAGLPLSAGPAAVLTPPQLAEEILAMPSDVRSTTLRSGDEVVAGSPDLRAGCRPRRRRDR